MYEVSELIDSIIFMCNCTGLSIQKRTKSEEINFLLQFNTLIKLSFKRSIARIMPLVD